MPKLKPFQKATVKVALKALCRKRGNNRFLVADEVGLGKTLVAAEIIRRMVRSQNRPLVVLYVCSNLSIAAQNKKRLLEWLPEKERELAVSRVDRLTLLPEHEANRGSRVHLYALTPDTSIPMRGSGSREGKKKERALIHALVKKTWPEFFKERGNRYFQGNVGSHGWRRLVKEKVKSIEARENRQLRDMFRLSVRKELKLEDGEHVITALNRIEDDKGREKGRREIIARLRNALAAGALEQLRPDLVIFDEFQRFRDLLEEDVDASAASVIKTLRGDSEDNQSKLLLLSATPYRPYTKHWEDEKSEGDNSHRQEFFELLEFLYRQNKRAKHIRKICEGELSVIERELRKGEFESEQYEQAKKTVEKHLRRVICRTERPSVSQEPLELPHAALPTSLEVADLRVFKHMARSFNERHKSAAPSYWCSIPLPMQTMGPAYKTWKASEAVRDSTVPSLSRNKRDKFKKIDNPAHPRLRALKSVLPIERLSLPWMAPTAPWWPLKGPWKTQNDSSKVLVFSRFRAVPQAISSLLSYDLETHLLSSDIEYEELSKRRSLQPKTGNAALLGHFYPSVFLAKNIDPLVDPTHVKGSVNKQLHKALRNFDIQIREGTRHPTWKLISALDRMQLGSHDAVDRVIKNWSELHVSGAGVSKDGDGTGFKKMLRAWKEASTREISSVSPAEFKDLARYALSSPGVVVGRALARHWQGALEGEGLVKSIEVSWKGLRNYLSSRLFMKALTTSERKYPEAIRRAALEGNLESVLDEHLWIASKLSGSRGAELADELLEALRVRTSNFFMHPLGSKSKKGRFSLRCHAAMPFTDPRAEKSLLMDEDGERPIRADELRKAFNTPFWPHMLVTTSVGQEGLDFHVWCETLLHWDLCSNPVDLEQREGRIRRYGGLAIRKWIAQALWNKKMHSKALSSLWAKLEKMAEREFSDAAGLSPWWICQGAEVKRLIIDMPASEQKHRLEALRHQRLLYRLALGQPNQEDLLEVLSEKYGGNSRLENIGLNLSAFFRP